MFDVAVDPRAEEQPVKISVAMATYNGAKFVKQQLNSLAEQTRRPDELVICDDSSKDETLSIVTEFSKASSFPVKLFANNINLGYSDNFLRAASLCEGDIICFCDQDDYWTPSKLEFVQSYFARHPECFCLINNAELTDEQLRPAGVTVFDQADASGLCVENSHFHMGCCISFRRPILAILSPLASSHDHWLSELCAALGCRRVDRTVLQYYRRHENTATNTVGAQLKRTSYLRMLMHLISWQDFKNPAAVVHDIRASRIRALRDRLSNNETYIVTHLVSSDQFCDAISILDRQLNVEQARFSLQRLPVHRRAVAATGFLLRGGYSDFMGIRSFCKDLIRWH
jgi:glycosyltransferase involved in cell wall biosynthesis